MKKIKLELNSKQIIDPTEGRAIMITPPIDNDYWLARVNVFEDQYIQAFPKFGTIGCGFAIEDDWNTNLPISCDAEEVLNHIWHNRRYIGVKKKRTLRAIKMIQDYFKPSEELKNG